MVIDPAQAAVFEDVEVARVYSFRPPYPERLYELLNQLTGQHRRALDLGCGTGKIASRLSRTFRHVDAVDRSLPMLEVADSRNDENVSWIHGSAEDVLLSSSYDLVTAGASIHWMHHPTVFPRIANVLAPGGVMAIVEGDDVDEAQWESGWLEFIECWLLKTENSFDPCAHRSSLETYRPWLDITGERTFRAPVSQHIDHFVACQHSRVTWSRINLGNELYEQFDIELRNLLLPYTIREQIQYVVETSLVWGYPRHSI